MSKAIYLTIVIWISLILVSCKSSAPKSQYAKTKNPQTKSHISPEQNKVLNKAFSYVGTTYRMGGMDHNGMDCSGLVCVSFKEVEISLPRTAHEQANVGKRIYIGELEVGDLIFFSEKKGGKKITHVGIVSFTDHKSSTKFIHASTSKGVREDELLQGYWRPLYVQATRVLK